MVDYQGAVGERISVVADGNMTEFSFEPNGIAS